MENVLWVVGSMLAGLAVVVLQGRAAQRRGEAAAAGQPINCPAALGVGTGRLRRGRLTVAPDQLVWRPLFGGRLVDLSGSTVIASAFTEGANARPGDVSLRLAVPALGHVRLQLAEEDATAVVDRHPDAVAPSPAADQRRQRRRRTWWAWLCLVLAAGWAIVFTASYAGGYPATATVTGGDGEGFCTVAWDEGPGHAGSGEVGCSDEPAGSQLTVRVLMWPDENDPWDPGSAVFAVLLLSLPLTAVGVWRLLYVRNRRPVTLPTVATDPLPAAARLDDGSWQRAGEPLGTFLARLAPYARRQVPADGWERPGHPAGATTVVSLRRLGAVLAGPALLVTCTLAVTASSSYRWAVLTAGATGTTVAEATGATPVAGWGPFAREVTVRFEDAAGDVHRAEVVADRDLARGDRVSVEYAVDQPGQARLVDDAGATDGLAVLGAVGLGVAALWAGWRVTRLSRSHLALRRVREAPERPVLGLLTADGLGGPMVLLCDPLVAPARFTAVPLLAPLPHGTVASFAANSATSLPVRGGPPGDLPVIVRVLGGPTLLPGGRAFQPDAERVIDLLDSVGALARETAARGPAV